MKKVILTVALCFGMAVSAWAAGELTESCTNVNDGYRSILRKCTLTLQDVDANDSYSLETTRDYNGYIMMGITKPYDNADCDDNVTPWDCCTGSGTGTCEPTDNYDIAIADENGVDVFGATLSNRSTSATQQATPYIGSVYGPRYVDGKLTVTVVNNTAANAMTDLILYVEE